MEALIPVEVIERKIYFIRGHKVMLDEDLAELYEVPTKRLNEQVRRNEKRFPQDFMFQLSGEEAESLRSQNATLKKGRGRHRKYLPYVFTEQGVAMLSTVLKGYQWGQVFYGYQWGQVFYYKFFCYRKMIMSYVCKIKMSYFINATMLPFNRRHDGGKGHYYAATEGTEATPCHS